MLCGDGGVLWGGVGGVQSRFWMDVMDGTELSAVVMSLLLLELELEDDDWESIGIAVVWT